MSETILYDLPSRGDKPACWSLNPWKARMALNYKGIPYRTEWTEYPDLAPTFKELGIAPNEEGSTFEYSSPAVRLPDGSYVMDSRKIALALDIYQPEPTLHMGYADVIDRAQNAVSGVLGTLAPIVLPRVPVMLLNDKSAKYFNETREARFGISLPELGVSDKAKGAWEEAKPKMEELRQVLTEKEGKYVLGDEVSFADFVVAGFWVFMKKVDQGGDKGGDIFGNVMGFDDAFPRHMEACSKWLERED
ncbi:uncharacterized protein LTR77_006738 [Saxophila tyrrhenica]|uniref:GST N-terminal domain-containing protein n=1 Tax=Saxophila tyrrhenica TaxID=1690608 RepID=A0AAV9P5H1_9PEZI|nr:hypothetical protein LTR77_006738 [Saxophila tyrrhenica]